MYLKSSVTLLLIFGFINCTPAPYSRQSGGENLLSKDVEESVKQLTNEVEKSIKHLSQNSQWIYNNLVTILRTSVEKGFRSLASWAVDFVLRSEFLLMADGSHLFFPLNGKSEIEREYKTVALAVSKLLMNLKTMERTDQILKNVSVHMITTDADPFLEFKAYPEKVLKTFLHMYFEILDHRMEADEELRDEYKQRKSEAEEVVRQNPKMNGPLLKVWDKSADVHMDNKVFASFVEDKKIFRQGAVNKLFMKQSVKHIFMIFSVSHHQRYLLARALIQKARSSSSKSKVNEVYQQALARAAEQSVDEEDDVIADVLFNTIEKVLESEPALNAEIRILMKQIEVSTVYDTDMFQIDFSFL